MQQLPVYPAVPPPPSPPLSFCKRTRPDLAPRPFDISCGIWETCHHLVFVATPLLVPLLARVVAVELPISFSNAALPGLTNPAFCFLVLHAPHPASFRHPMAEIPNFSSIFPETIRRVVLLLLGLFVVPVLAAFGGPRPPPTMRFTVLPHSFATLRGRLRFQWLG